MQGDDAASAAASAIARRRSLHKRLNDRSSRTLIIGAISTLAGGACWGFSGTCVSFLFEHYEINPFWLLCMRQFFAGSLFVILALATDRDRLFRLWRTPAHLRILFAFMIFGLLSNQLLYLLAIRFTNAGTATVLQALQLLVIMGYACVSGHRTPKPREIIGLALALVGTVLIATGGDLSTMAIPPIGLAVGLLNALAAALFTIIPRGILREYGSASVTGSAMFLCGAVSMVIERPWTAVPALDPFGWGAFAVLVVVGSFLAFLLYMHGVAEIGSLRAGLLGTIEPISATVTSALLLGTVFTGPDLAGFAMIIVMMFLTT